MGLHLFVNSSSADKKNLIKTVLIKYLNLISYACCLYCGAFHILRDQLADVGMRYLQETCILRYQQFDVWVGSGLVGQMNNNDYIGVCDDDHLIGFHEYLNDL